MKKWIIIPVCFILLIATGCSSTANNQSVKQQVSAQSISESNTSDTNTSENKSSKDNTPENNAYENNTPDGINQNNEETNNVPLWAQPVEEHGQLFTGLNLDGIGENDDEVYISLYYWDNNGFKRYDASEIVIRIRFGTGDTTAHIIHAVGSYQFYTAKLFSENKDAIVLEVNNQYANSGLVSVFALDIFGAGEVDSFPSVVERLNTDKEEPVLSADGERLYTGSLILGTAVTDIADKPLQGITLLSSGDGYSGPIDARESQTIYWNSDGWIVLDRSVINP